MSENNNITSSLAMDVQEEERKDAQDSSRSTSTSPDATLTTIREPGGLDVEFRTQQPTYSYNEYLSSERYSAEALAHKFSNSLANIAAAGVRKNMEQQQRRHQQEQQQQQRRGMKRKSVGDIVIASNDETCGGDVSSSSSGSQQGSGQGPAPVTSSGDDRDSSGISGASSKRAKPSPKASNGDSVSLKWGGDEVDEADDCLIHHKHRQRKHYKSEDNTSKAQHSGLQIPLAEGQSVSEHKRVVAHLPPPNADGADSSGSSSQGDSQEDRSNGDSSSLLPPYREPCLHTIRKTFNKIVKRDAQKNAAKLSESIDDQAMPVTRKHKGSKNRQAQTKTSSKDPIRKKRSIKVGRCLLDDGTGDDFGSSGSGTEGGYAASSSSNGNEAKVGSCSSPSSEESSEDSGNERRKHIKGNSGDPTRPMLSKKQESALSVSSEIADFSSSASAAESYTMNAFEARSESPSITSSSNAGDPSDEEEQDENLIDDENPLPRKGCNVKQIPLDTGEDGNSAKLAGAPPWLQVPLQFAASEACIASPLQRKKKRVHIDDRKQPARIIFSNDAAATIEGKPPILALGCDIMAHVLTFLEPPDILDVLTMPLSNDWLCTFTRQPELWRVLCLLEPFKAQVDDNNDLDDEFEHPGQDDDDRRHAFGKFRLLYTSFVRCMKYLVRIKDDAVHGRPPSVIDYGLSGGPSHSIIANRSLQHFLSRARGVVAAPAATSAPDTGGEVLPHMRQSETEAPSNLSDEESLANSTSSSKKQRRQRKTQPKSSNNTIKYGHSKLTQRLLGPAANGRAGEVELPWSCGIYSIVNWMVAFADVEGIQTMCLKVLPCLLENEQQRITAQRAGLTDIVLRAMVLFPNVAQLHTAAFHTIVLLARPLGGQEGMLFHTSMVNSSGIFSPQDGSTSGRNGIAVLLDSMRRFRTDKVLQSMSCWSLVNIALAPAQKEVLVKLGGIEVTTKAMMEHPYDAEVQFRALFALINLVIPSVSVGGAPQEEETQALAEEEFAEDDTSEREMLDEMVSQIVNLVVLAMKNFCSNEAILNRACLVLHNLSLTPEYHEAILWTPNCYQMLEWCLGNFRTDQVLQQSAAGTLHRLQMTLSADDSLRARFAASIQAQHQLSLEQAHREAIILHEQHAQEDANAIESSQPQI